MENNDSKYEVRTVAGMYRKAELVATFDTIAEAYAYVAAAVNSYAYKIYTV